MRSHNRVKAIDLKTCGFFSIRYRNVNLEDSLTLLVEMKNNPEVEPITRGFRGVEDNTCCSACT